MHAFQLGSKRGTQQKYAPRSSGNCGINMVSLYALVIVFVTTKDKAISWSYCYCFATSEVITKIQNINRHGASSASGRQQVVEVRLIYLYIYFLYFIRSFQSTEAILRSSSAQNKNGKNGIPNVNNNSRELPLAATKLYCEDPALLS